MLSNQLQKELVYVLIIHKLGLIVVVVSCSHWLTAINNFIFWILPLISINIKEKIMQISISSSTCNKTPHNGKGNIIRYRLNTALPTTMSYKNLEQEKANYA